MRRLANFILGVVFILSGALKLIDPVGTGFIIESYLEFMHITFLSQQIGILAIIIPLSEGILGAAILSRIFRKTVKLLTFIVLGAFTALTAALAIVNPLMDCGCFGEAIHLTHAQTLIKNVVLLLLAVAAFVIKPKKIRPKYVGFGICSAIMAFFCIYGNTYIPPVDFTEYAATVENISIFDADGHFCSEVAVQGDILISSIYDPEALGRDDWSKIIDVCNAAEYCGLQPLCFIASAPEDMETLYERFPEVYDISHLMYYSDPRTLATLNRSNGGYSLVCEGEVINKWSARSFPGTDKLNDILDNGTKDYMMKNSSHKRLYFQACIIFGIAAAVLF